LEPHVVGLGDCQQGHGITANITNTEQHTVRYDECRSTVSCHYRRMRLTPWNQELLTTVQGKPGGVPAVYQLGLPWVHDIEGHVRVGVVDDGAREAGV